MPTVLEKPSKWRNWKIRLMTLIFASIVWVVIISEEVTERTISIPIVPYADKEGLIWSYPMPGEAIVRVQGKVRSIWWVDKIIQPKLKLPLSTLPDSGFVLLRTDMLELEGNLNIKVLSIVKPDTLPVKVEKRIVKNIPIQPNIFVIPAEGFILTKNPYTLPSQVEVSGKKSDMVRIQSIGTDTIIIQNATTQGKLKAKLIPPYGTTLGLKEVEVKYQVERIVETTLENVEVVVPKGWIAIPSWITVKIQGPASEIANLQKKNFQAKVMPPLSNERVKPYFDLPSACKIVDVKPQDIELKKK